jgi:hypothetical protein
MSATGDSTNTIMISIPAPNERKENVGKSFPLGDTFGVGVDVTLDNPDC